MKSSSNHYDYQFTLNDKELSFEDIVVTVPEHSEIGTWTLDHVSIGDAAGNYRFYTYDDLRNLGIRSEFEVINSIPDTTDPTLQSFETSAYQFDVSQGDETFYVNAHFTDDLSGLLNSYLNSHWRSPSGELIIYSHAINNDEPILSGQQATLKEVEPGNTITISSSELLEGFIDPNGDELYVGQVSTEYGNMIIDQDSLTGTLPIANDLYLSLEFVELIEGNEIVALSVPENTPVGPIEFSYTVNDEYGNSVETTQIINVVSNSPAIGIPEGTSEPAPITNPAPINNAPLV